MYNARIKGLVYRSLVCLAVFIAIVAVDCSFLYAEKGFRIPQTHKKIFKSVTRWQGKTFKGNDAEFIAEIFIENRRFLPRTKKVLRKQLSSGKYGPQVLPSEKKLPGDVHLFHIDGKRTLLALHVSGPYFITVNKNNEVVEVSLAEEQWKKALVSTRRIIHPEENTPQIIVAHPKGDVDQQAAASTSSPIGVTEDWLANQPTYLIVLMAMGLAIIVAIPLALIWRWAGQEEAPKEPTVAERLGVLDSPPKAETAPAPAPAPVPEPTPEAPPQEAPKTLDPMAPTPPGGMAKAIAKQLAAEEAQSSGGLPPIEPSLGGGGLGSILSTPQDAQVPIGAAPEDLPPSPEGETLNPESEEEVLARLRKRLKQ